MRVCFGHGSTPPTPTPTICRCRRGMADYVRLRHFVGRASAEPTPKLIGIAGVILVVPMLNACIEVGPFSAHCREGSARVLGVKGCAPS